MSGRPILALLALATALPAQEADLLTKIWNGVQQAQTKHVSGCGKITETRTSKLLAKPMIFRGRFCAEGMARFSLEYTEPESVKIRFNQDYLNVTTGDGKNTEVIDVGGDVRRTQSYFGKANSIANLKKNFEVTSGQDAYVYFLRLVPVSANFRRKLNYVVVRLDKEQFLLRSLEVDGKSGVNSVFTIELTSLDTKIPASTFEVYRPR
jgi:outer membrane lipoprotein-sorting protein